MHIDGDHVVALHDPNGVDKYRPSLTTIEGVIVPFYVCVWARGIFLEGPLVCCPPCETM
jgi:hypothetical protein